MNAFLPYSWFRCISDPNLDANQRIEILEQKLQDLRKKYLSLKQELISIDKKRKKLRRKEREGSLSLRLLKKRYKL